MTTARLLDLIYAWYVEQIPPYKTVNTGSTLKPILVEVARTESDYRLTALDILASLTAITDFPYIIGVGESTVEQMKTIAVSLGISHSSLSITSGTHITNQIVSQFKALETIINNKVSELQTTADILHIAYPSKIDPSDLKALVDNRQMIDIWDIEEQMLEYLRLEELQALIIGLEMKPLSGESLSSLVSRINGMIVKLKIDANELDITIPSIIKPMWFKKSIDDERNRLAAVEAERIRLEELKDRADELGLTYPPDITAVELEAMIAAEEKRLAELNNGGNGNSGGTDKPDPDPTIRTGVCHYYGNGLNSTSGVNNNIFGYGG